MRVYIYWTSIWIIGIASCIIAYYLKSFMIMFVSFILLLVLQMVYQWKVHKRITHLQAEEQFQYVLNNLPMAVLLSKKGKVRYVNANATNMIGANNNKQVVGQSISEIFDDMSPFENQIGKMECKLNTIDNKRMDIELTYKSIVMNHEMNYFIVVRDISMHKESQKLLEHSEQLNVIGELAAGIAHEIRNPLTSLKGFLQLLKGSNSKNKEAYIEIMLTEIERINNIVGELLHLSKPKVVVKNDEKSIVPILRTVVTIVNTQAIIHNIQINFNYEPRLELLKVKCEENKLKQVFINILKNAMEAMSNGGTININISVIDQMPSIHIVDEGEGIPKDQLAKLGSRYYSTKENGTGLGLMISFSIIKEHDGEMRIRSEEGKGTEVEIVLPYLVNKSKEVDLVAVED